MIYKYIVTAFAMPLVFFANSAISASGLGYGLGASFTLYAFMAAGMKFAYSEDY